jgi:hypothetical protein
MGLNPETKLGLYSAVLHSFVLGSNLTSSSLPFLALPLTPKKTKPQNLKTLNPKTCQKINSVFRGGLFRVQSNLCLEAFSFFKTLTYSPLSFFLFFFFFGSFNPNDTQCIFVLLRKKINHILPGFYTQ